MIIRLDLGTQGVNEYFEEIDSFNQSLKEQLLSISEPENQTPQNIEQLLKTHYHSWSIDNLELIRLLLEKRKYLLAKSFEYTPENIENLLRVNRILSEGSEKVLLQAKKMHKILQVQDDDFTQDFEIKGTVQVSYNGNDSLIDFNPDYDEDCEAPYPSPPHIMEIIDSAMSEEYSRKLFYCRYNKGHNYTEEDDGFPYPLFCEEYGYWCRELIKHPEFQGIRFSWAFKNLVDHSLYALQDIIRINDFWNEVTVIYQNFDGDMLIVKK